MAKIEQGSDGFESKTAYSIGPKRSVAPTSSTLVGMPATHETLPRKQVAPAAVVTGTAQTVMGMPAQEQPAAVREREAAEEAARLQREAEERTIARRQQAMAYLDDLEKHFSRNPFALESRERTLELQVTEAFRAAGMKPVQTVQLSLVRIRTRIGEVASGLFVDAQCEGVRVGITRGLKVRLPVLLAQSSHYPDGMREVVDRIHGIVAMISGRPPRLVEMLVPPSAFQDALLGIIVHHVETIMTTGTEAKFTALLKFGWIPLGILGGNFLVITK